MCSALHCPLFWGSKVHGCASPWESGADESAAHDIGPDGKPEWASSDVALRWLRCALLRLSKAHNSQFKLPCFWLLANIRLWPGRKNKNEPRFAALHQLASEQLGALGAVPRSRLWQHPWIFGQRPGCTSSSGCARGLCTGSSCSTRESNLDANNQYAAALRIAVLAIDGTFQDAVRQAYTVAAAVGELKVPAVKSVM